MIEIKEDIKHQKFAWKVRKTGYIIILILVLLAFAGLFGSGFLSNGETSNKNLSISYERFTRAGGKAELILNLKTFNKPDISLKINNEYLKTLEINRIVPAPSEEKTGKPISEFIFKSNPVNDNAVIKIYYTAGKPGIYDSEIIYNEDTLKYKQVIYP